ncbi:hypothetical protein Hanom_Chr01g00032741 [Helianthus anomalus]
MTTSLSSKMFTETLALCFLMPRCSFLGSIDVEHDDNCTFLRFSISTSFCNSGMYFSARDTVPGILTFFCWKMELYDFSSSRN